MKITVEHSHAGHPPLLVEKLREADRKEVSRLGFKDPLEALIYAFRHAIIKRTAFVDDEIAAMWGVCGVPLSIIGTPYLLTTPAVERAPLTFVKMFRAETEDLLHYFPILENYVDAEYTGAVKLLSLAGYTLEEPEPLVGNAMFIKFHKRAE